MMNCISSVAQYTLILAIWHAAMIILSRTTRQDTGIMHEEDLVEAHARHTAVN
jgi:hypothetical protein